VGRVLRPSRREFQRVSKEWRALILFESVLDWTFPFFSFYSTVNSLMDYSSLVSFFLPFFPGIHSNPFLTFFPLPHVMWGTVIVYFLTHRKRHWYSGPLSLGKKECDHGITHEMNYTSVFCMLGVYSIHPKWTNYGQNRTLLDGLVLLGLGLGMQYNMLSSGLNGNATLHSPIFSITRTQQSHKYLFSILSIWIISIGNWKACSDGLWLVPWFTDDGRTPWLKFIE